MLRLHACTLSPLLRFFFAFPQHAAAFHASPWSLSHSPSVIVSLFPHPSCFSLSCAPPSCPRLLPCALYTATKRYTRDSIISPFIFSFFQSSPSADLFFSKEQEAATLYTSASDRTLSYYCPQVYTSTNHQKNSRMVRNRIGQQSTVGQQKASWSRWKHNADEHQIRFLLVRTPFTDWPGPITTGTLEKVENSFLNDWRKGQK